MTLAEKLGCLDGDIPFWPGLADMGAGGYYRIRGRLPSWSGSGVPGISSPTVRAAP